MKRQKEGRGVERQKGAKSASVSSDDDAFLSERQTDAVVTREASSRELPEEEDPSEARVRMEAEMAVSLEEACAGVARARRRPAARLTYQKTVLPLSYTSRTSRVPVAAGRAAGRWRTMRPVPRDVRGRFPRGTLRRSRGSARAGGGAGACQARGDACAFSDDDEPEDARDDGHGRV